MYAQHLINTHTHEKKQVSKHVFFFSTQHIVYLTKFILSYVIPDVPYAVREQIKREKYLTHIILHEANLKLVTKRLRPANDDDVKETNANLAMEELELDCWWCGSRDQIFSPDSSPNCPHRHDSLSASCEPVMQTLFLVLKSEQLEAVWRLMDNERRDHFFFKPV